ncbi:protein trichome berefringence-like 7 [Herrania umbratica]|uniref:Protein trichome berefringence-like 7 n=1 Tax=Herrania umbratica TaxID=108875 RepID=A0A6J0ZGF2_9ROSI|nr:protein trichome berefringence-like 7 [Herrania umbratica]
MLLGIYWHYELIEMVNNFSRSTSFNRRALNVESPRFLSIASPSALNVLSPKPPGFASPRVHHRLGWVSRLFPVLILIGALISFFIVIGGGYMFVLPSLSQAFLGYSVSKFDESSDVCDIFDGSWVIDDSYPLYNASECPFAEQGFNCLGNGRKDKDYLKWRWKPKNCDIPRFNVQNVLEMLRDKRVVFVGDSMSRTQWESLICLLMTGVEDKKSVYEVNGNKITKRIRFLGVRFSSFNFTIEFFRSVFLVQHGWMPRHAPKRVRSTLKLDKLDDISNEWINADVLIFNTGQWWVPGKLFETGCYFQVENSVKLGMSIPTAFRTALGTWASWVENMIDANRTLVFFRTFEPSHWSEKSRRFCNVTQNPLSETEGRDQSIFSETIFEVIKNMTVPITLLHVTSMSALRRDAHVGRWSDNPTVPDCSHWCLPGVPDVWNEIFLSYLLAAYELPAVYKE